MVPLLAQLPLPAVVVLPEHLLPVALCPAPIMGGAPGLDLQPLLAGDGQRSDEHVSSGVALAPRHVSLRAVAGSCRLLACGVPAVQHTQLSALPLAPL
ncbi:hypothetical protein GDO78_007554 [Eleutherodactylus coqui]|uniref:Uncharacterized protein n=1 Tax=Eleutherodactylus coqui TaxID=57060 RepID=A0A8J6KD37_ELECQ|nr:hypothetical protein GDO78_007554 [Eleutherodactylus coqui]